MENRNGPGNGPLLMKSRQAAGAEPLGHRQPHSVLASLRAPVRMPLLLAALGSGALLWLCYFPVGFGWLAWVALVPLLALVRAPLSWRRIFLLAWVTGLVFYFLAIKWMRVADYRMYFTWIALSLYCSLFMPVGILLVRRLDQTTRLPLVITLPAVWAALEYFRAHVMTGFPWYFLGHSQHDYLRLIQMADLGGVYAVTAVVAAVNALVFEWLDGRHWFRRLLSLPEAVHASRPWLWIGQALAVAGVIGAALLYGDWRLDQKDFTVGPRLALIQGNLDQRIRNEATSPDPGDAPDQVIVHFRDLSDLAAVQHPQPDLLVWPETSWPGSWEENPPGRPTEYSRQLAHDAAHRWRIPALLGLTTHIMDGPKKVAGYNSALLIGTDSQATARYDKIHRVPFGEYVPLREWLPWMDAFAPYDYDYSVQSGQSLTRFPLGPYHFGALICYEDTDPYLARQYVRRDADQPAVDFLLNISNDGWFDGTSEHEEHLAICRFRAIESRRAVARSVNMGVSAIIDGSGRVLRPTPKKPNLLQASAPLWEVGWGEGKLPELPRAEWARFKKVSAVILGAVPIDHRYSVYAHWGDWLPQACWVLLGISLFWSVGRVARSA